MSFWEIMLIVNALTVLCGAWAGGREGFISGLLGVAAADTLLYFILPVLP